MQHKGRRYVVSYASLEAVPEVPEGMDDEIRRLLRILAKRPVAGALPHESACEKQSRPTSYYSAKLHLEGVLLPTIGSDYHALCSKSINEPLANGR